MEAISYRTISANAATVQKQWIVIDAENEILGRLSTEVAKILRGKHKASFTPHVDCGDNVIILNCGKVRFTGNKMTDKLYVHHTGYPGGQRHQTATEIMKKDPTRIITHAVKGMLPKNRLGRAVLKNLYVYEGSSHPHEGQTPKVVELKSIK
ncbi:MAG: 50S ribosomal protein L13 [Bacteroidales bacterium]|nr:50S ribosomal protein L13 [Bacteroidales bacterium]